MSEFYSYEGLRDSGTFLVDSTTKTAISEDPKQIIGKVVTVTGNGEAGYGSAGDIPLGFVEMVEKEVTNSEEYVISVQWHQVKEDIDCAGSETAGKFLTCDGNGGVQESSDMSSARAISIDSENKKCIVKFD